MIQTIKMKHWFDSEGWNIKDGVQDGRQLVPKTYLTNILDKNPFYFLLLWMFIG